MGNILCADLRSSSRFRIVWPTIPEETGYIVSTMVENAGMAAPFFLLRMENGRAQNSVVSVSISEGGYMI